jgi:hypothetical protein
MVSQITEVSIPLIALIDQWPARYLVAKRPRVSGQWVECQAIDGDEKKLTSTMGQNKFHYTYSSLC